jgi:uncharacterized iron-regulated membrane protein
MDRTALYRTIWRWHFYAGLFVIPLVLILSVTGAIYLFKPQVERWEERAFQNLLVDHTVPADAQVRAALTAYPGARFQSYRLPERQGDAALIHVGLSDGKAMRDVFVSPQGKVLGALDPQWRIMQVAHDIHGQLLLGPRGSWIVELAASWAIVMILTGLYLGWPRSRGLAGVVWPRLASGSRIFWRDLHAVAGFWVAGLAMVLLLTGLPWADVWGGAFKTVRAEMGWVKGKQDWTIGGRLVGEQAMHAEHDPAAMMGPSMAMPTHEARQDLSPITLNEMVARARADDLAFPVIVTPPGALPAWTVKSDAQNRPLRVSISYEARSGREISRETFADKHGIDRIVGYGIAWHEGQLFGLINQLIGLATALLLITVATSGFIMWRRRKPDNLLGAPALPAVPARMGTITVMLLVLAALLPLLAVSLVVLWVVERLVLIRIPAVSRWLGLSTG